MKTRRAVLLSGLAVGLTGSALLPRRAGAFSLEEMTPDAAAAFDAACQPVAAHAGLIAAARDELLSRIASGQLPAGASERVGCPICGCTFTVTVDGAL